MLTDRNANKQLAGFKELYQETYPRVRGLLTRLGINNKEDLAEIIQETYLEAYRSQASLVSYGARHAWVLTIARRQFFRFIERRRTGFPLNQSIEAEVASGAPSADDTVANQQILQIAYERLAKVEPEQKRAALLLYFFESYSLSEVAQQTGVNQSTLTTWFSRARQDINLSLSRKSPSKLSSMMRSVIKKARVIA